MFERPSSGELAILVHIRLSHQIDDAEEQNEFQDLALAAGAKVAATLVVARSHPEAKYFIGSGKAAEIQESIATTKAQLVIFNHSLSPAQERNLEKLFNVRVIDRTGLILDIFAQRARTFEGKLQVELAQLKHLATRLVRGWTHLERQRGGIGLRGPGETQLETDRRLVRTRMKTIGKRLEKVRKQRDQNRRGRQRSGLPIISLVGYTNAGKSTLFNQLTQSDAYVANQLFATLDPTMRRCQLKNGMEILITDTVGFIRQLPHDLVEAFRATLEETVNATLLLHVIDASSKIKTDQIEQVNEVLNQIDANKIPQLLIYNKIDLLPGFEPRLERNAEGIPYRIWISAKTGKGLELIGKALEELMSSTLIHQKVTLLPEQAKLRAKLYAINAIEKESINDEGGWDLMLRLSTQEFEKYFPK